LLLLLLRAVVAPLRLRNLPQYQPRLEFVTLADCLCSFDHVRKLLLDGCCCGSVRAAAAIAAGGCKGCGVADLPQLLLL
jgi:hypothetical protein